MSKKETVHFHKRNYNIGPIWGNIKRERERDVDKEKKSGAQNTNFRYGVNDCNAMFVRARIDLSNSTESRPNN